MKILFFLLLPCSAFTQQINPDKELKNALEKLTLIKTLHFKSSFEGTGSRKGKVLTINADVFLKKNGGKYPLVYVKANVLKPMFDKSEDELVIYDGNNVFSFDFPNDIFIERGAIDGEGKKYLGFNSIVWQRLLSDDLVSFSPQVDKVEYEKDSILRKSECMILTIKRPAYDSRIFIEKNSSFILRVENLTSSSESPGASVFDYYDIEMNKTIGDELFRVAQNKQKRPTKELSPINNSNQVNLLPVGSEAPGWKLTSLDSREIAMNDFLGKLVVLDFTATWCAPCKIYEKRLAELYNKNQDKLVIIGLSYNEKESTQGLQAFIKKKGIRYPIALNAEKIAGTYKVLSIPTIYVIDKNGKILLGINGYSEQNEIQLFNVIKANIE